MEVDTSARLGVSRPSPFAFPERLSQEFENIDATSLNVANGHLLCTTNQNRTVVFQFEDGETRALTRIPMEKTSNGIKFIPCQLPLQLIFAGTVHRSQGMTLQRAVIGYRTKFWEHGQLYVARSRVKSPIDLYIYFLMI
jgi:ATP-dependent exoDNAse (exonuclease V) alpha subunit